MADHRTKRASLPAYVPPSKSQRDLKRSLGTNGSSQDQPNKRQNVGQANGSVDPSLSNAQCSIPIPTSTPHVSPWHVTGHYRVSDRNGLIDTSTGYEMTIFHNTTCKPSQLYARFTFGHLTGLMRFCPHPSEAPNPHEPHSFYLKDFEEACNLKDGDVPGPRDSTHCKQKWLMRWRAREMGMGLGKKVGGELDLNMGFDFVQKPGSDMAFSDRLFWIMLYNGTYFQFDAYKTKDIEPEEMVGESLWLSIQHWSNFEREWEDLLDIAWLQPRSHNGLPPRAATQTATLNGLPKLKPVQTTQQGELQEKAKQSMGLRAKSRPLPQPVGPEQAVQQQAIQNLIQNASRQQPPLRQEQPKDLRQQEIQQPAAAPQTTYSAPQGTLLPWGRNPDQYPLHQYQPPVHRASSMIDMTGDDDDELASVPLQHVPSSQYRSPYQPSHQTPSQFEAELSFFAAQAIDAVSKPSQIAGSRSSTTSQTGPGAFSSRNSASSVTAMHKSSAVNAKPGEPDAPWLRLTARELVMLRKRMKKKKADFNPSDALIARELRTKGRAIEDYNRHNQELIAAGLQPLDIFAQMMNGESAKRVLAESEIGAAVPDLPPLSIVPQLNASQPALVSSATDVSKSTIPARPTSVSSNTQSKTGNKPGGSYWKLRSPSPKAHAQFEDIEISSGSEEDIPARRKPSPKLNNLKKESQGNENGSRRTLMSHRRNREESDPSQEFFTPPQEVHAPNPPSPSDQLQSELTTPHDKRGNLALGRASDVHNDSESVNHEGVKRKRGRPRGSLGKSKLGAISSTSSTAKTATSASPATSGVKRGRGRPPAISAVSKPQRQGSEPPTKKTRYIPGGPGGGGRQVYEDGTEVLVGGTGPGGYNYTGDRGQIGTQNREAGVTPVIYPGGSERTSTAFQRDVEAMDGDEQSPRIYTGGSVEGDIDIDAEMDALEKHS